MQQKRKPSDNSAGQEGQSKDQRDEVLDNLTRDIGTQIAKIGQGLQESMAALQKEEDARMSRGKASWIGMPSRSVEENAMRSWNAKNATVEAVDGKKQGPPPNVGGHDLLLPDDPIVLGDPSQSAQSVG